MYEKEISLKTTVTVDVNEDYLEISTTIRHQVGSCAHSIEIKRGCVIGSPFYETMYPKGLRLDLFRETVEKLQEPFSVHITDGGNLILSGICNPHKKIVDIAKKLFADLFPNGFFSFGGNYTDDSLIESMIYW